MNITRTFLKNVHEKKTKITSKIGFGITLNLAEKQPKKQPKMASYSPT